MNDKMDIPDGSLHDIDSKTDLDVPDLPGPWEWLNANHYHWNHKVNVYFGYDINSPGGQYGEIDNWVNSDGDEMWTVHIRPIVDDGTETGIPRETADVSIEHELLAEAIEAVPSIIEEHYGDDQ